MDETPNLKLPYILAAQAQKHVTHNEAIRALDAIVQTAVLDSDLTVPPASPTDGDRYIVAPGATAAWLGKDGQIAAFQDGAWSFYAPREGWIAWVADEDRLYAWDGAAWIVAGGGGVNPTPLVGVNATADTTNRLAVSSPASLFNHEGAGHQLKVNRDGERQHHHRFERRCFRFVEHRHPGTGRYRADADQLVGPHYVPRCGSAQVLHRCDCAERECRRRRGHDLRHRRDWRCSARIF